MAASQEETVPCGIILSKEVHGKKTLRLPYILMWNEQLKKRVLMEVVCCISREVQEENHIWTVDCLTCANTSIRQLWIARF